MKVLALALVIAVASAMPASACKIVPYGKVSGWKKTVLFSIDSMG